MTDPDSLATCPDHPHMYNTEHHHSGLGLLTPADVHHGLAEQRVAARATVLTAAYAAHPGRFPAGRPGPPVPPVEVWINPPKARAPEEASTSISADPAILDPSRSSSYARPTLWRGRKVTGPRSGRSG